MNDITELDQLRRQVRYLMDRSAVLDCISTHSRGHDRHDVDLTNAAHHPDGVDEHGYAVTPATEYAARINQVHAAGSQVHTHTHTVAATMWSPPASQPNSVVGSAANEMTHERGSRTT